MPLDTGEKLLSHHLQVSEAGSLYTPLKTPTLVSGFSPGQAVRMWITPLDAPEPYIDDAVAFTTSTCDTCSIGR